MVHRLVLIGAEGDEGSWDQGLVGGDQVGRVETDFSGILNWWKKDLILQSHFSHHSISPDSRMLCMLELFVVISMSSLYLVT